MRNGGFAGWCLIAALLPGPGAQAQERPRDKANGSAARVHGSQPPEAETRSAGARILEQEPLCVLAPRAINKYWGEHMYVTVQDRAALEPFLQAGLVKLAERPTGAPDDPERIWYDVTDYAAQWSASCLVNRYAYPVEFGWGFRIGTPEIVKVYPLDIWSKGECEIRAGVLFEYRIKLEPWFVPGRFETNFGTEHAMHYFDAAKNIGRANVHYTSSNGKHRTEEPISYGHQRYILCDKLK